MGCTKVIFLEKGYRVIAQDRRRHGRSEQTPYGHDMDTYAADVAENVAVLNLKDVIHVGYSTGGGAVIRYIAKHGGGRVAKAMLLSAVTPIIVKNENNPNGVSMAVFDDIRNNTANHRQQFYIDLTFPFYGYNRDGAKFLTVVKEIGGDKG